MGSVVKRGYGIPVRYRTRGRVIFAIKRSTISLRKEGKGARVLRNSRTSSDIAAGSHADAFAGWPKLLTKPAWFVAGLVNTYL